MNKVEIGYYAGKVWTILNANNGRCSYEELRDLSALPERELNAAIGWLAREDKIEFEETYKGLFIFLPVNFYF